ncbi:MAG TPA: aminotransferase class I/II-fold pyridoxal phosphate-dependent enzyme, partial [Candidatus Poseidoniaceae archaeon]|nr:aminotransferase class I/II-fold pyridoxal phosphate-dependent enzyme [Candidatus Poseidoniaceae archaeon]
MPGDQSWMTEKYSNLVEQGLDWKLKALETASEPRCIVDGKQNIMLCANNYLNLTTHQKVVNAMIEATQKFGAGSGSVRAIAGNMQLHEDLESTIAKFKGVEAALTYSAGYTANVGLIPTLVENSQDLIISDELNHGSIIDGVRLTKASRAVYPHNDTDALEKILKESVNARRKLIITDGVFSMDGDIAPLDLIAELAEQYGAMVMVDDCHGEGVLGDGGRGIVDHFKLQGKIDFEIGSFSKALGVQGGVLSGSESVKKHAINHSRSWLLSGSQPPGVAAAQKAAIEVLRDEPEHHEKLWSNTEYFRKEMQSLGFDTGVSETPIIPVMCGESRLAKKLSEELYKKGIFALPIVFPMVAKDKARIRCMISSGLTKEDLDIVIGSFSEV